MKSFICTMIFLGCPTLLLVLNHLCLNHLLVGCIGCCALVLFVVTVIVVAARQAIDFFRTY